MIPPRIDTSRHRRALRDHRFAIPVVLLVIAGLLGVVIVELISVVSWCQE